MQRRMRMFIAKVTVSAIIGVMQRLIGSRRVVGAGTKKITGDRTRAFDCHSRGGPNRANVMFELGRRQ